MANVNLLDNSSQHISEMLTAQRKSAMLLTMQRTFMAIGDHGAGNYFPATQKPTLIFQALQS